MAGKLYLAIFTYSKDQYKSEREKKPYFDDFVSIELNYKPFKMMLFL